MNLPRRFIHMLGVMALLGLASAPASAHHVLGRPAYSWNEDSSTPPTMSVETQIGHYMVTLMVFPAFPRAGEESRVKLYASHLTTHLPLSEPVRFSIRDDRWWGDKREEDLGVQEPVDAVYRQIVVFSEDADYILTASFQADGEPYIVEVPVRIGAPANTWAPLAAAGVVGGVLIFTALKKRRRRPARRPAS